MDSKAENCFCYVIAGFWVEIPEDSSRVEIFRLPAHDQRGSEGRPTEFPIKQLGPKPDDKGAPSHPATLLAARVWCNHAADQIRNDVEPDFDGDGMSPPAAATEPLAADDQSQVAASENAAAGPSVAQGSSKSKPKRQAKRA